MSLKGRKFLKPESFVKKLRKILKMEKNTFKLATLNVHGWNDANGEDNVDRIVQLVKKHDPDIICFQETTKVDGPRFARQMNFEGGDVFEGHTYGGCSIRSKFPLKPFKWDKEKSHRRRVRAVTAEIDLGNGKKPIFVTSLHLDHRVEPMRLSEESLIAENLSELFDSNAKQIWTGDFNALTQEDYTAEYWEQVRTIRERNLWESPKTELTSKIKSRGMIDCWEKCGRPAPIKTCRFDTRIDYIFASPSMIDDHELISVQHIDDRASDHNMVIAKFQL